MPRPKDKSQHSHSKSPPQRYESNPAQCADCLFCFSLPFTVSHLSAGHLEPEAYVVEGRANARKKRLVCTFCAKRVGIHKMKMHLAGRRGDVGACKKVSLDVQYRMEENLAKYEVHKRENETVREASNSFRCGVHQFKYDVPEEQDVKILVKATA
ncbi:hypothetical protein Goshw_016611 [Gossypium schwendimanii]|uniref:BED-type domain-containing protein n=1 Tax=Gossypium schwendimanii TaxID=34291 RepID=A0A7J9KXU9_GOSSC|nr:hypothetical protein [Gossypium schwendimanii]